jgi:hypothetical protein
MVKNSASEVSYSHDQPRMYYFSPQNKNGGGPINKTLVTEGNKGDKRMVIYSVTNVGNVL